MAFNPNRSQEYRIEVLLDRLWETGMTGQQGIDKMKVNASNRSLCGSLLFVRTYSFAKLLWTGSVAK
jgi:hypothetical protein